MQQHSHEASVFVTMNANVQKSPKIKGKAAFYKGLEKMIKILFVCHGNICRSAAAEYIMKDIVKRNGREDEFHIESKGTSAEEIGNGMYPPMYKELKKLGITVKGHRARRLKKEDYDDFDFLIGMDSENWYDMNRMWSETSCDKLHLLMDYVDEEYEHNGTRREVSDPWYTRDFAQAARDITEGCKALYAFVTS